jgi:YHS domain-containing protein
MKLKFLTSTSVLAFTLACIPVASTQLSAAAPTDSEIIAKARATYPLKTCLVSDEPLGSMGEATGYIHRVAGQPDRVVFFCCEGCTDDFKADPAKFLKKVDAAAKGKPSSAKPAEGKSGHKHQK